MPRQIMFLNLCLSSWSILKLLVARSLYIVNARHAHQFVTQSVCRRNVLFGCFKRTISPAPHRRPPPPPLPPPPLPHSGLNYTISTFHNDIRPLQHKLHAESPQFNPQFCTNENLSPDMVCHIYEPHIPFLHTD